MHQPVPIGASPSRSGLGIYCGSPARGVLGAGGRRKRPLLGAQTGGGRFPPVPGERRPDQAAVFGAGRAPLAAILSGPTGIESRSHEWYGRAGQNPRRPSRNLRVLRELSAVVGRRQSIIAAPASAHDALSNRSGSLQPSGWLAFGISIFSVAGRDPTSVNPVVTLTRPDVNDLNIHIWNPNGFHT